MLFSTLVLVPIYCEHNGLEQSINLCHRYKTTEVCNMARLGLKKKEKVAVFLCLFVVGKEAFLYLCCIFEMAGNLVLLPFRQQLSVGEQLLCILLQVPYDFGSIELCANRDTVRPFPIRSSSSIARRF